MESEGGHFSVLPNEVLEHIFGYLTLEEVTLLCKVCKKWNEVMGSDLIWSKFVPRYSGFQSAEFEASTSKGKLKKIWKRSVKIGKERWFPNPLVELKDYEEMYRHAEHRYYQYRKPHPDGLKSKSILLLRLNPVYNFSELDTTKNPGLLEAVDHVFRQCRGSEPYAHYGWNITDSRSVMERGKKKTKQDAMKHILTVLERSWHLRSLGESKYEIREDGGIVGDHKKLNENDEPLVSFSKTKSDEEKKANIENVRRISINLFYKIKSIFIDRSSSCVWFPLDDGVWNENLEYAREILISDQTVFFSNQFYEL